MRAAASNEAEGLIAEESAVWNARVDAKTRARPGHRLTLALDMSEAYFFDPSTGENLISSRSGAIAA